MTQSPWEFYDRLIRGIPEEIRVKDVCVGPSRSYVEADSGLGVAYATTGGGRQTYYESLTGKPLREAAMLSKSWNWTEASLGVSALNAWYATEARVRAMGGVLNTEDALVNPFHSLRDACAGKKIAVVGHFPGLIELAKTAELTILERNCRDPQDVPDPACEYVIPSQDFVFMTGVTIINKTAPRLLELSRNAITVMVGPSVIADESLFERGANILGGRVATDPEKAKAAVKQDVMFPGALCMFEIKRL
jgi:uncharacterized protein (DUF4213/DUF364 family)